MSKPAKPAFDPEQAASLLRALAHPMRLQILVRLTEGELAVSGFEAELGLKQPNLSQQLSLLREAGLVGTRRESKSVVYRLADGSVGVILDALRAVQGSLDGSRERRPPRAAGPTGVRPSVRPGPQLSNASCGMFARAGWELGSGDRS